MLRVGITGGIGSGKSIVCRILSELGYPVFHSDLVAKEILDSDPEVKEKLKEHFGESLFSGSIVDRKRLAEVIFKDPEAREFVNQLIHPKVRVKFNEFSENSRSELVFNEAAILFETGSYKGFDLNVLVSAPNELKIKRVMMRDHISEEQVRERMSAQWDDTEKTPLADFVLINDEKQPLLDQIEEMLADLVSRSQ